MQSILVVAVHTAGFGPGDAEVTQRWMVEVLTAAKVADVPGRQIAAITQRAVAIADDVDAAAGAHGCAHFHDAFVGYAGVLNEDIRVTDFVTYCEWGYYVHKHLHP